LKILPKLSNVVENFYENDRRTILAFQLKHISKPTTTEKELILFSLLENSQRHNLQALISEERLYYVLK
jgi:hypothetical protein